MEPGAESHHDAGRDVNIGRQIDFVRSLWTFLENRIHIIDRKANILLAIQVGLIGIFSLMAKELLIVGVPLSIKGVGYVFLFSYYVVVSLTVLKYLIMIIHPTRTVWQSRVSASLEQLFDREIPYVVWPEEGGFPKDAKDYQEKMDVVSSDPSLILKNIKSAHFYALQLVKREYNLYRKSITHLKFVNIIYLVLFFVAVAVKLIVA